MDAIMHIVLVDAAKHLGQKIWQVVNVRCECLLCVDEECRVALDTAIRLQLVEQQSGVQQQKTSCTPTASTSSGLMDLFPLKDS